MHNACCLNNVTLCRAAAISPPSLHSYLSTHLHGCLISAHNLAVGGALKTQNTSIYHFWIPASLPYCLSGLQSYSALICSSLALSLFLKLIFRYTQPVPNNNTNMTKMRKRQPNVIKMPIPALQSLPSVSRWHYRHRDRRLTYLVSHLNCQNTRPGIQPYWAAR